MQIFRTSELTGNTNVMNIDITQEQLHDWIDGSLIQDVMPDISADEREFIMTGITPDEWLEKIFVPIRKANNEVTQ